MAIVNETSFHGKITYVLTQFCSRISKRRIVFDVFLTVVLFPENSETNFILILPLQKN